MQTLRADLSRLQKERDMDWLKEIKDTMEHVKNSVEKVIKIKKKCWVATIREDEQMRQIDNNIELVEESIKAIS